MNKHTDQRKRTLLLASILWEETDEKHPLTLAQLLERLEQQGAAAERKAVYRDLAALRRQGLRVVNRYGREGGWYLEERDFSFAELSLIADAIGVYPYLSQGQRAGLLDKLGGLTSVHQRQRLHRNVALPWQEEGREIRSALERIDTACREGKALSFLPCDYDRNLEKVPAGKRKLVSPKGLVWTGREYQLLGWDHGEQCLRLYRLERMGRVLVSGAPALGPEADPSLWAGVPFGQDPGQKQLVKLRCHASLAGEVVDHFGQGAAVEPQEDGFFLTAEVVVSSAFWTWVLDQGERAEVVAPTWIARQWRDARKRAFPQEGDQAQAI